MRCFRLFLVGDARKGFVVKMPKRYVWCVQPTASPDQA
ncbi:MAG: hypothetical protein K0S58_2985 [Nitrospira sp.]|nr:hypothetical protein [Nitrospira sp.]